MSRSAGAGRLGNQIFRNLATSIIAEKNDLNVFYGSYDEIKSLGIKLFSGTKVYEQTVLLTDDNYFNVLQQTNLPCNLWPNENFFQTNAISCFLYRYLQQNHIRENIMGVNPFKDRYNNNNDCFIHLRLGGGGGDCKAKPWCPLIKEYKLLLSTINFDNLYIASDLFEDEYVIELTNAYPTAKLLKYDEIKTIQFASTCKHVMLSTGSFSAVIGYLSFFSDVYYPKYKLIQHPESKFSNTFSNGGDMLTIPGWHQMKE